MKHLEVKYQRGSHLLSAKRKSVYRERYINTETEEMGVARHYRVYMRGIWVFIVVFF